LALALRAAADDRREEGANPTKDGVDRGKPTFKTLAPNWLCDQEP
jgi:hypothetical protein